MHNLPYVFIATLEEEETIDEYVKMGQTCEKMRNGMKNWQMRGDAQKLQKVDGKGSEEDRDCDVRTALREIWKVREREREREREKRERERVECRTATKYRMS